MFKLSGAKIASIGTKVTQKNATTQTAFVFTMVGASRIGSVLTGKKNNNLIPIVKQIHDIVLP